MTTGPRTQCIGRRNFIPKWNLFLGILDLARAYAPTRVTESDFTLIAGILGDPNGFLKDRENRQELWGSHVWREIYKSICRDETIDGIPCQRTILDQFVKPLPGVKREAALRLACFAYPRYMLVRLQKAIDKSIAEISTSNAKIKAVLGTIDSLLNKCKRVDERVAQHMGLPKFVDTLAFQWRVIKSRAPSKLTLMHAIEPRRAVFLIAGIFLGWGAPEKDADHTNPTLFEVRQECNEIAAFFPAPLARARHWVPPEYNLAVDAEGSAVGALIFMSCPDCYSLTTPNAPPLEGGENIAPGSVVHLWFMLQGPAEVLTVPGAQETAPTQYAYAMADLVTSPIAARVYRRAGKKAVLISGATLVEKGNRQTGAIKFTNGSKITFDAYTPTQLPMPLKIGGNIWNWHVGGSTEMDDDLGDNRYPVGGNPGNVNTTRVMFLATVPGPPNTTLVNIHADPGTAFADYYGTNNVVASRASFFRPNNIVNNSSRGKLAWTSYPPYALSCPPFGRSSQTGVAGGADLKVLLERYLKASNRHDLKTLRAMTAEDAVWKLGPDLLAGRDEVLTPNACDAGANTRLNWSNLVVHGNTVEFELIERNDVLRALGIPELRHFVRFTFEDGLVKRKEEIKPAVGIEALHAKGALFLTWLRRTHPDALGQIMTSEGKFIYSRENCRIEAKLAAEWARHHEAR